MQGGRKASTWNLFVKKIYHEGHSKNANYSFKQALQDASKRKGEMSKSTPSPMGTTKKSMKKSNSKTKKGRKRKNGSRRRH
jgi:hypothetical protein